MKFFFVVVFSVVCLSGCVIIEIDEIICDVECDVVEIVFIEVFVDVNLLDLCCIMLVVCDIEKLFVLYCDVFGMIVEYDQEFILFGFVMCYGVDGQNWLCLVLFKVNDSFIGMFGLWQFLDQME